MRGRQPPQSYKPHGTVGKKKHITASLKRESWEDSVNRYLYFTVVDPVPLQTSFCPPELQMRAEPETMSSSHVAQEDETEMIPSYFNIHVGEEGLMTE